MGRVCMPMSFSLDCLKVSLFLSQSFTLFSFSAFSHSFPPVANLVPRDLRMLSFKKACLLKLCIPVTPSFVLLCDCQSACVCVCECFQLSFSPVLSFVYVSACLGLGCSRHILQYFHGANRRHFFQFTRFSSDFFEARLSKCYLKSVSDIYFGVACR